MPALDSAAVTALLRDSLLLSEDLLAEVGRLAQRYAGADELLLAILRRRWLTPFQAREIVAGRGRERLLGDSVRRGLLGEGSTSRVFPARPREGGEMVALKVFRGKQAAALSPVALLRREHRAGTRLDHPNLLQ